MSWKWYTGDNSKTEYREQVLKQCATVDLNEVEFSVIDDANLVVVDIKVDSTDEDIKTLKQIFRKEPLVVSHDVERLSLNGSASLADNSRLDNWKWYTGNNAKTEFGQPVLKQCATVELNDMELSVKDDTNLMDSTDEDIKTMKKIFRKEPVVVSQDVGRLLLSCSASLVDNSTLVEIKEEDHDHLYGTFGPIFDKRAVVVLKDVASLLENGMYDVARNPGQDLTPKSIKQECDNFSSDSTCSDRENNSKDETNFQLSKTLHSGDDQMESVNDTNVERACRENECDICHRVMFSKYAIKRHKLSCHPNNSISKMKSYNSRRYQCDICNQKLMSLFTVIRHKHMFHPKEEVLNNERCVTMKKATATHKCNICGKMLYDKSYVLKHKKTCHSTAKVLKRGSIWSRKIEGQSYPCDCCKKILYSEYPLSKHRIRFHPKVYKEEYKMAEVANHVSKKWKCKFCGRQYTRYFYLQEHLKNVKFSCKMKYERAGIGFSCEVCASMYPTLREKEIHIDRIHKRKEKLLCEYCGKLYRKFSLLEKHSEIHKTVGKPQCIKCDKFFSTKDKLGLHLREIHSNAKNLICDICGKCFKSTSGLRQHKQIHTAEKPYKCNYCEARFLSKEPLIVHNRSHTGECPYACKECDKRFKTFSQLVTHNKIHSGIKEHKCHICREEFRLPHHLQAHIRRKHPTED